MADEETKDDETLMREIEDEVREFTPEELANDMVDRTGGIMTFDTASRFLEMYDGNLEAALHGFQEHLLAGRARAPRTEDAEDEDAEDDDAAADANANTQTRELVRLPEGAMPGQKLQVVARQGHLVNFVVPTPKPTSGYVYVNVPPPLPTTAPPHQAAATSIFLARTPLVGRGLGGPSPYDEVRALVRGEEDPWKPWQRALASASRPGPGGGGKKSRKRRTKRRHKTGGKKSRKQRKRTTIKGGKRKRCRTRRRR